MAGTRDANGPEPDEPPPGLCASCPLLATGEGGVAACSIRGTPIAAPAATGCASHPDYGRLRRPFPIGPVVQLGADGPVAVAAAPATRAVRERLLDLVADIHVRGLEPLSFREAVVVWQLRQLDEPRAYPHLDRIEAAQLINASRARGGAIYSPFGLIGQVLGHGAAAGHGEHDDDYLSRLTLAGRMLLLSSVLVGGGLFAVLLALEVGLLRSLQNSSLLLHVSVLGGVATLVGAGWLRLGMLALDRAGVAYRRGDDRTGADPATTDAGRGARPHDPDGP